MMIMVVDGQGGGIGKALIERLKNMITADSELIKSDTHTCDFSHELVSQIVSV